MKDFVQTASVIHEDLQTRSLDGGSAKIAPETPSFPEHTRLPDGAAPGKQGRRRKSFGGDQERVISSGKQALPEQQVQIH